MDDRAAMDDGDVNDPKQTFHRSACCWPQPSFQHHRNQRRAFVAGQPTYRATE